jgi:translation initiation factor 2A
MGAYRPPGARGQSASLAYTREEDNGSPVGTPRGSGTATPTRQGRPPVSPPNGQARRHIPGAAASPSNPEIVKPRKRKGPKEKADGGGGRRDGGPVESSAAADPVLKVDCVEVTANEGSIPLSPGAEPLDPVQKKVRNLSKKVSRRLFIFLNNAF